MELPNYYIFPMDRMHIIFCSPYSDLREVEANILLQENGLTEFTGETINKKLINIYLAHAKCNHRNSKTLYFLLSLLKPI